MTDCDDPDDPVGTFDRLIDEFESAGDSFRANAEKNRERRADADDDPDEFEGLASGPPTEFLAEPYLAVLHTGGAVRRPIARRSELPPSEEPTLRGEAITVETPSGSPAAAIDPAEPYQVACTIQNVGGTSAKSTRAELYVDHLWPDRGAIDTTDGTVEIKFTRRYDDTYDGYEVTGVTTMAPGSQVTVFVHSGAPASPPYDEVLHYSVDNEVSPARTFSAYLDGLPKQYITGERIRDTNEFTVEAFDTTVTDPSEIGPNGRFFEKPGDVGAIRLATAPARFKTRPGANDDRADHDLTSTVPAAASSQSDPPIAVGETQYTSVPGNGRETVRFTYVPDRSNMPPARAPISNLGSYPNVDPSTTPGVGRAVTAFYLRVYSLATAEMPANWDRLDHTTSRFMGRTEIPRLTRP